MHTRTAIAFRYVSKLVNELKDKVVLITGAGKGCGRILAGAFAEHGACVAANDISPVNVEEVVKQITNKGGRAKTYVEDVAKKLGAQFIIKQVEEDFGQIDILINHAAVQPHVPLLDMDEWDWHRVLDVNLTGAFLMTQSVGRVMRERGKGVIINLVTESARAEPGQREAAFVASMSALAGFTRQAALELSPYGIHVLAAKNDPETIVDQVWSLLSILEEQ
jgi:NAD(P)-dependent dehydrogenase (short-subunit alcohol dehydrogenase family)